MTATPANVGDEFLDSTIAASWLDHYISLGTRPSAVVWTGTLLAPRTGAFRMEFSVEGKIAVEVDGRPVSVQQVKPEAFQATSPGTVVQLEAGAHPVRVNLTLEGGGRTLVRWNWVPPTPNGQPGLSGRWSIVPRWC